VAVAAGCEEKVVAPARCPALCPSTDVQLLDTILADGVASDTSFRGYVALHEARMLVLSSVPGARAAGVARFNSRSSFWLESITDTIYSATFDSITLSVRVVQRDTAARNVRILVYRAPRTFDTLATWDTIAPFVDDSLLVDSIAVPDSLASGLFTQVVDSASFEPFPGDSGVVTLLFGVRADQPTTLSLASTQLAAAPRLDWAARAADTTRKHVFQIAPFLDTFLEESARPGATDTTMFAGGMPSARALVRFNIPRYLVDSTTVVRGTLLLRQVRPAAGRPGDVFTLEARGIIRDLGPKSFFTSDAGLYGAARVTRGDTAQIAVDVTQLLRTWRGVDPDSLPRSILLRVAEEGETMGAVEVGRAGTAQAPVLRITYIRPYTFGVP